MKHSFVEVMNYTIYSINTEVSHLVPSDEYYIQLGERNMTDI